jgi:hypothetical protein
MNLSQVTAAIMQGQWTNDDVTHMALAVKFARAQLVQSVRRVLRTGDNVEFVNSQGLTVTGFVEKVAIKYVTVKTLNGKWRVPANMLSRIADDFPA